MMVGLLVICVALLAFANGANDANDNFKSVAGPAKWKTVVAGLAKGLLS